MDDSPTDVGQLTCASQERGEASEAVIHILAHVHELADEAGLTEMAAIIGRAKARCVNIHVGERRHILEAAILQGGVQ